MLYILKKRISSQIRGPTSYRCNLTCVVSKNPKQSCQNRVHFVTHQSPWNRLIKKATAVLFTLQTVDVCTVYMFLLKHLKIHRVGHRLLLPQTARFEELQADEVSWNSLLSAFELLGR